jgi:O-methyltransferase involved in polyketide biosynthesis
MYLPPEAVGTLFEQCAAVTGPGSRMAFTYIGTRANGRPDAGPWTWLVLWILRVGGEPWLWATPAEELRSFLNEHGWEIADNWTKSSDRYGVEFHGIAVR